MFELTSLPLLVLLGFLCVIGVIALTTVLPRMAGRWWWWLIRLVSLVVVIALTMTTSLVYLNDQYGWYVSWSDLLGNEGPQQVAMRGAAPAVAAASAVSGPGFAALPAAPKSLPPLPQPGQRLQNYTVSGKASGATGPVQVYLPASYAKDAPKGRHYPVILAYHGFPSDPNGWTRTMRLPAEIDTAVAQHRLAEAVVVVPQINIPKEVDTECVNGPSGSPQMETWLAQDIPAFVVTHFSVVRARSSWATMGYSLGAWCSAMIGLLHPDLVGGTVSLGGYYQPDFLPQYSPYQPGSAGWEHYDLVALVQHRPPPLAMWVQTGDEDRYRHSTRQFLHAVKSPLSVTSVSLPGAGHRVDVWQAELPAALVWLGASVPGFHPR